MAVSLQWSVSVSYPSATSATVSVTLKAKSTSGSYNKTSSSYGYIKINGTKYGNFSHTFSANTTTTLGTKSHSVTRTTTAQSIPLYAWWHTDVSSGNITKSGSTSVAARPAYTVIFNGNGGTSSSAVVYYGYAATFPTSSRTGYTFNKWNGVYAAGTATPAVTGDATYYAYWIENTATLSYNANGYGVAPASTTMYYTTAATTAAAITGVTGYHFTSWNTNATGTGSSYAAGAQIKAANVNPGDTILYAQWEINTYTVEFITEGGSVEPTIKTKIHGETISVPTPVWAGHIFAGWETVDGQNIGSEECSLNGDQHEDNIVLHAVWSDAARPVILHYYGSATDVNNEGRTYKIINENLTPEGIVSPLVANYKFKGWYTDSACTSSWEYYDYTQDLLNIVTTPIVEEISDYYEKDDVNHQWIQTSDTDINPEKTYYVLAYHENMEPLHLYAKWNKTYTVIYNINNPSYDDGIEANGYITPITIEHGQSFSLAASSNYSYGIGQCTASGWSLNSGNNSISEINNVLLIDNAILTLPEHEPGYILNLYAVWTPTTYHVYLEPGDGASGNRIDVPKKYYSTYILPDIIPDTWSGPDVNYYISNWILNDSNIPVGTNILITNNITYIASWIDAYHVPVINFITTERFIDENYTATNLGGKFLQIKADGIPGSYDNEDITSYHYDVDVKFYATKSVENDPVEMYVLSLSDDGKALTEDTEVIEGKVYYEKHEDDTYSIIVNPTGNPKEQQYYEIRFKQEWGSEERPIIDKGLQIVYCVLTIIDATDYNNHQIDLDKRTFTYTFDISLERGIGLHLADDLSTISMFKEISEGDKGLIVHNDAIIKGNLTTTNSINSNDFYLNLPNRQNPNTIDKTLYDTMTSFGWNVGETLDIKELFINILQKGRAFQQYTGSTVLTNGGSVSFSVNITTHGGPVLVVASGTWNGDAAGYWSEIYVSRGTTVLSQATMVSAAASYNVPGTVVYMDYVSAGTYTYTCTLQSGSGSGTFSENNSGRSEAPILCAIEL